MARIFTASDSSETCFVGTFYRGASRSRDRGRFDSVAVNSTTQRIPPLRSIRPVGKKTSLSSETIARGNMWRNSTPRKTRAGEHVGIFGPCRRTRGETRPRRPPRSQKTTFLTRFFDFPETRDRLRTSNVSMKAVRGRFELPRPFRTCSISSRVLSTAQSPHRGSDSTTPRHETLPPALSPMHLRATWGSMAACPPCSPGVI